MKRPTPPPLTKAERAALNDLITRAARTLPTDTDRNRLLRLHELDAADRQQERRTAGGLQHQVNQLRQQLKDAEAALAALHEGEEPAPLNGIPHRPGQWITLWNAQTPTQRLAHAQRILDACTEISLIREGEEPYENELTMASPAQWVWLWNRATPAERLAKAEQVMNDGFTATNCRLMHPR